MFLLNIQSHHCEVSCGSLIHPSKYLCTCTLGEQIIETLVDSHDVSTCSCCIGKRKQSFIKNFVLIVCGDLIRERGPDKHSSALYHSTIFIHICIAKSNSEMLLTFFSSFKINAESVTIHPFSMSASNCTCASKLCQCHPQHCTLSTRKILMNSTFQPQSISQRRFSHWVTKRFDSHYFH